jgi:hypothetical protein
MLLLPLLERYREVICEDLSEIVRVKPDVLTEWGSNMEHIVQQQLSHRRSFCIVVGKRNLSAGLKQQLTNDG